MKSSTPRTKRRNKPIVFLFGPTAVGKTALIESGFAHGFEVVNADSMQVYHYLDIGSAKPSSDLMQKIPHHLVDILDPWEQFTVGQFIALADKACDEIWERGNVPVLTGGTAYYFRHFLYGLPEAPASDPGVRERVAKTMAEKGLSWAYDELGRVDPISAGRINAHDEYRISRALEVYAQSGQPLSDFALSKTPRRGIDPLIIGLVRDKEELYDRIRLRVDIMFKEGLLDEIRALMRMGAEASWPGMQGIGYREFFSLPAEGECSIETIKAAIVRNSRLYAKRQLTFFRSFSDVVWLSPSEGKALRDNLLLYGISPDILDA